MALAWNRDSRQPLIGALTPLMFCQWVLSDALSASRTDIPLIPLLMAPYSVLGVGSRLLCPADTERGMPPGQLIRALHIAASEVTLPVGDVTCCYLPSLGGNSSAIQASR